MRRCGKIEKCKTLQWPPPRMNHKDKTQRVSEPTGSCCLIVTKAERQRIKERGEQKDCAKLQY